MVEAYRDQGELVDLLKFNPRQALVEMATVIRTFPTPPHKDVSDRMRVAKCGLLPVRVTAGDYSIVFAFPGLNPKMLFGELGGLSPSSLSRYFGSDFQYPDRLVLKAWVKWRDLETAASVARWDMGIGSWIDSFLYLESLTLLEGTPKNLILGTLKAKLCSEEALADIFGQLKPVSFAGIRRVQPGDKPYVDVNEALRKRGPSREEREMINWILGVG